MLLFLFPTYPYLQVEPGTEQQEQQEQQQQETEEIQFQFSQAGVSLDPAEYQLLPPEEKKHMKLMVARVSGVRL